MLPVLRYPSGVECTLHPADACADSPSLELSPYVGQSFCQTHTFQESRRVRLTGGACSGQVPTKTSLRTVSRLLEWLRSVHISKHSSGFVYGQLVRSSQGNVSTKAIVGLTKSPPCTTAKLTLVASVNNNRQIHHHRHMTGSPLFDVSMILARAFCLSCSRCV